LLYFYSNNGLIPCSVEWDE